MSETLVAASRQWATRPADERHLSLPDLERYTLDQFKRSSAKVLATRALEVQPVHGDPRGLVVKGPGGATVSPTHWAFSQLAQRAGAPASYFRDQEVPTPLVADLLNWGLRRREVEDVGVLLRQNGDGNRLVAMTGPNYGRIWNYQIAKALREHFGDGLTGTWRIPGEFSKKVEITKANTTLYAGDRDMFVFLADEDNRIEIPNRRDGKPGSLARGFFMWNSEVGAATFGIAGFLFDFVCSNRMVWGAEGYKEVKIRHTSKAPYRMVEEVLPALEEYRRASARNVVTVIESARKKKLGTPEEVEAFLAARFSKSQVTKIKAAAIEEEGRPIETVWDAATAVTAAARDIPWQDDRVDLERKGGALLALVA